MSAADTEAPKPYAWLVEFGAVSLPPGHPSRITELSAHFTEPEARAAAGACEFDARVFPVWVQDRISQAEHADVQPDLASSGSGQ